MKLYVNTDTQIRLLKEKGVSNNYIDEWEDVIVESIHNDLLQLWLYLAGELNYFVTKFFKIQ